MEAGLTTLHSLFDENAVSQTQLSPNGDFTTNNFNISDNIAELFENSVNIMTTELKDRQADIYDMMEGKSAFMNVQDIFDRSDRNVAALEAQGDLTPDEKLKLSSRAMMEANMEVAAQAMKHTYKAQEMHAYTTLVHGTATKVPETFKTLTQG